MKDLARRSFPFVSLVAVAVAWTPAAAGAELRRPNVVLIMTDNHGAWTLGCYGNPDTRTPNIDRLAREGILFQRAFSSNAVCSPSRATYLTGLIPSQHGVHCWLRGGGLQVGPGARNTLEAFESLPEILSEKGYVCGLVGKWHLGGNLQPQEGFTTWVTMPAGHTSTFYDAQVIENGKVRKEARHLTEFWTDGAIRFLEEQRSNRFFLFLAYNGPYGLGRSLLRPARHVHAEFYADKTLDSFPRLPAHPWLHQNQQYLNNLKAIRRYAAELSAVDAGVGRVLATLRRLRLDEETLVIFCGDQGWGGGQHGLWGMADHSRPLHAFDETMRVPLILRHSGSIPGSQTTDILVSNYDLLPTVLGYLGWKAALPDRPVSPGRDFSRRLLGKKIEWDNVVFYEFENTRVIRTANWKYVRRFPSGPNELYDLARDPGETRNLVDAPAQAATHGRLEKRLAAFFARYADERYDLWRGGGAQSHLIVWGRKPAGGNERR